MFYYVLLNDDLIATAVVATTELVVLPEGGMALDNYTPEVVGMRWTGSGWAPGDARPAPLTQLAFLRRFTAEERIACRASSDPVVQDFLHLLGLAQDVRLDDADTVAGVNYLESLGLLAEGRAAAVLA
ncbi:MAG: hypothetical protein IPN19_15315 [Elusimicrobia bacterium]|nr:hypothetical protein [Elusimicrobiota bacterium]